MLKWALRVILLASSWAIAAGTGASQPSAPHDPSSALQMSDALQQSFAKVADNTPNWTEPAFYMLLGRAAGLADIGAADADYLDKVAYENLLSHPSRYRGREMQMSVRVYTVRKMSGEHGLGMDYSRTWPRESPVWRMYCTAGDGKGSKDRPLIVFSVVEPDIKGDSSDPAESPWDEVEYSSGPRLDVAGMFYKTMLAGDRKAGSQRAYPVLVAWQVGPAVTTSPAAWMTGQRAMLVVGLVGLVIFYVLIRRRFSKRPTPIYKTRRDADDEPGDDS